MLGVGPRDFITENSVTFGERLGVGAFAQMRAQHATAPNSCSNISLFAKMFGVFLIAAHILRQCAVSTMQGSHDTGFTHPTLDSVIIVGVALEDPCKRPIGNAEFTQEQRIGYFFGQATHVGEHLAGQNSIIMGARPETNSDASNVKIHLGGEDNILELVTVFELDREALRMGLVVLFEKIMKMRWFARGELILRQADGQNDFI